ERATGVDQALSDTTQAVRRINDMAAQIATACEEQSSVTEEIARNINDIRDLSDEASSNSAQSMRASQDLSGLSQRLAELVGRFRVRATGAEFLSRKRRPANTTTACPRRRQAAAGAG